MNLAALLLTLKKKNFACKPSLNFFLLVDLLYYWIFVEVNAATPDIYSEPVSAVNQATN